MWRFLGGSEKINFCADFHSLKDGTHAQAGAFILIVRYPMISAYRLSLASLLPMDPSDSVCFQSILLNSNSPFVTCAASLRHQCTLLRKLHASASFVVSNVQVKLSFP